jgi:DNA-directed RNA polymerase specialized sigma24 family protein
MRAIAEDVVQDRFNGVRQYRASQLRQPELARAWLFRIGRSTLRHVAPGPATAG